MRKDGRIRHALPVVRWPTAEEASRSLLFSPLVLNASVTLEQRTWVPAMVPWRATETGFVTQDILDWYRRFAEGRPGAIVVEATGVRDIKSGPLLRIGDDRFIEGLSKLVETVREASDGHTKLFIQIIDFLTVRRRPERSVYFSRYLELRDAHREGLIALSGDEAWGAADGDEVKKKLASLSDAELELILNARELESLRFGYRERVTDTHLPHIREIPKVLPEIFAAAAHRAERAGFDGVELHYAHAYTMASFLSLLNDRDDGYGGSRSGRLRLPLEVYEACRAALSKATVLGCRFLSDEVIEGGSRVDDAVEYGVAFARAGMDYLSLSKGGKFDDAKQPRIGAAVYPYTGKSGHECMPTIYSDEWGPFGRNLPLTKAIRAAVRDAGLSTPIVAAGGIHTFELAEAALRDGACDIVGSARGSLADPDWPTKVLQGRGEEVRRCQMTNYCEGLDQQHKQVTCRLWDRDFVPGDATVPLSSDEKRRLLAPRWRRGDETL